MPRFDPATEDFVWLLRHVSPLEDGGDFDLETAEAVLNEAARFIEGQVAPLAEASDRVGAKLEQGRVVTPPGWKDAYAGWVEAGWQGLGLSEDAGGQGAPLAVQAAVSAMLGGADLAFAMVLGGGRAAVPVLEAYADDRMRSLWLAKLASGEWAATIAITEPQAGTDVGRIATRAEPAGEGRYALSGTKIFISGGDQDLTPQILHLVLARTPGAPEGTRGLSLFAVPMWKMEDGAPGAANGVWASALEEKMGLHGSPTCVLNFDRAEGELVGEEHKGLQALFLMMNEMRLDVGLSAAGIMASATAHARAYAAERRQGRGREGAPAPIAQHPDVKRMLSVMAALTDGARALGLETARLIDLAHRGEEEEAARAARIAAFLTPVCKAGLSDAAVTVADTGVQVFGGHGYVRESGAEQFLRDARVLGLYEGANGVQAMDLAIRKLQRDGGAAFADLTAAIRADLDALDGRAGCAAIHRAATVALVELEGAADAVLAAPDGGEEALAAAYPFLELATHAALAWTWLRMAGADAPDGDPALARKQKLAAFFAAYWSGEATALAARVRNALADPDVYDGGSG